MRTIIHLILFFTYLGYLPAQTKELYFEHLDSEQGLSQGRVFSIVEDHNGFMWFGTYDGLNRYNGYNIRVFKRDANDSTSLSNNEIHALAVDGEGKLWVGTAHGLNVFHEETESFTRIYPGDGAFDMAFNNYILDIYYFNDVIYVTTNGGGFYAVNPVEYTVTTLMPPPSVDIVNYSNTFAPICPDSSNRIWFTSNNQLYFYDLTEHRARQVISPEISQYGPHLQISQIQFFNDSIMLFSTFSESIFSLNTHTLRARKILSDSARLACDGNVVVFDFLVEGDQIYAGTIICGLLIVDLPTGAFENYKHDPGLDYTLSNNGIRCLYKDSNGLIWLGTNGRGINMLPPSASHFEEVTDKLYDPHNNTKLSVRAFVEDDDGNMWVGGYNSLYRIDKIDNSIHNIIVGIPVYSLAFDPIHRDTLWVGMEGAGLIKYNVRTGKYNTWYPPEKKYVIPGYNYYKLLPDSEMMWVGTELGLNKLNVLTGENTSFFHDPDDSTSIVFGDVQDIMRDDRGLYWIGTTKSGIAILDGETNKFVGKYQVKDEPGSISSNSIKDIFQDRRGTIWVATTEGLNRYDRQKDQFELINFSGEHHMDIIYGLLEDSNHHLWFSTNDGLYHYEPETGDVKHFTISDGLQGNEFNTAAYYQDRNGDIYFGGVNGFNTFHPDELTLNGLKPKVVFTAIKKFNEEIKLSPPIYDRDEIVFDYDDAIFTVEFTALNFTNAMKNTFKYKVDGLEGSSEWISLGNRHSVNFTGLKHGNYLLHVKAANNDGLWNEEAATLRIIIKPPYWGTLSFQLSLIAIALILVWIWNRYRLRSINRQNVLLEQKVATRTSELEEANMQLTNEVITRKRTEDELTIANKTKDKFFSIIGHDLRSPLNSLLGFADLLYNQSYDFSEEEKRDFVGYIHSNATNLAKLTENLLQWANTQTGKLQVSAELLEADQVVRSGVDLLMPSANAKEITLFTKIQEDVCVVADRHMLETIVRNLISNAIKFTRRGGQIEIVLESGENHVEFRVHDNGIGMDQNTLEQLFRINRGGKTYGTEKETGTGLGLLLCKEFALKNHGDIEVISQPGRGSTFILKLPLGRSSLPEDN